MKILIRAGPETLSGKLMWSASQRVVNNFSGFVEQGQLFGRKLIEMLGQIIDAPPPAFVQQASALGGSANLQTPGILRVTNALGQPVPLKASQDARHRWRFHLFRGRQLPERHGPAKHQHR